MQAVGTVPWRSLALATVVTAAFAARPTPHRVQGSVVSVSTSTVPPATSTVIVDDWVVAHHLARMIEERRYGEIDASAARIDPRSSYARWVPAAIGLAIEQIDATSAGYARVGMCSELERFWSDLRTQWPTGYARKLAIACESQIGVQHGSRSSRHDDTRYSYGEQVVLHEAHRRALDRAIEDGDHARAVAACAGMHRFGEFDARCLAEACRTRDLAVAEAVEHRIEYVHRLGGKPWTPDEPGYIARHDDCAGAGITFDDAGRARADDVRSPSQLVRVHPDAPSGDEHTIIDW